MTMILLVGCAKNRPWPAALVAVNGFTADQKDQVLTALSDLNSRIGHPVVAVQTDPNSPNYPITIVYGTPQNTSPSSNLAGEATVSDENCLINISPKVFDPEYKDTLEPVVWHELGHCAGLVHVPTTGQIMYPTTSNFESYQPTALTNFYLNVLQSSGLAAPGATPAPASGS